MNEVDVGRAFIGAIIAGALIGLLISFGAATLSGCASPPLDIRPPIARVP